METRQNAHELPLPPADKILYRKQVQRELDEIRQEAEEAFTIDNEIDPVPDSAYRQTSILLEILYNYNIPMPHIGWAEDGSIGLEWRPEGGIVTMGIYGDDDVIYGAFFQENCQVDGVCNLSNTVLLEGFLETLKPLFNKDFLYGYSTG